MAVKINNESESRTAQVTLDKKSAQNGISFHDRFGTSDSE